MNEQKHITLRELQRRVRSSLEERFPLPVWVAAEISELKVNYSGHCYLELVEKGGDNGVPVAQARAVIWKSSYSRIAGYFEAETGHRLAAGMQLLARVLVTYHEIYGFSLQITDIDPCFTLGDMERQRLQTIERLRREGVWDMNRSQQPPLLNRRIAVVSSAGAAGLRDFMKEIGRSPLHIEVTLFEAVMQGNAAEESVIAALDRVAARMEEFDSVALIRGGGSASDLNCFNAYRLCNSVAQFPLPVFTGIGHDKDVSVADMVAYKMLKTPTAVAAWFVDALLDEQARIADFAQRLLTLTREACRTRLARLDRLGADIGRVATERRHGAQLQLGRLAASLRRGSSERLLRAASRLERLAPLPAAAARDSLARRILHLDHLSARVEAYDPRNVLQLGYALLRTSHGALKSAAGVERGEEIEITLSDGEIRATVNNTKLWQRKH